MAEDPVTTLLNAADREAVDQLLRRSGALRNRIGRLPRPSSAVVDAVLAGGDDGLVQALAGNWTFGREHPDIALRLAATGDPVIGTGLLIANHADRELLAAVVAACDPDDPGWRAEQGLVTVVQRRERRSVLWSLAGRTPFAEIDHAALKDRRGWQEQLPILDNLWRRHGPDELATALKNGLHPLMAELVVQVLADLADGPIALLTAWDRQLALLRSPQRSVEVLRAGGRTSSPLPDDFQVDWAAVTAAHAKQPFRNETIGGLIARVDCPDEFAIAHADRALLPWLAKRRSGWGRAVIAAYTRAARGRGNTDTNLTTVIRTSLDQGTVTLDDALDLLTPLSTLCEVINEEAGELRAALGVRVTEALGTDPGAWRAVAKLVPGWRRTLRELLAAAVAAAPTVTEWPSPRPAPSTLSRHPTEISQPGIAMRTLLNVCPIENRLAVLPVLDELTLFDLLGRQRLEPGLVERLLARGEPRELRMLAPNPHLTDAEDDQLLRVGDPDIHARIYLKLRDREDVNLRWIIAGVPRLGLAGEPDELTEADRRGLVPMGEPLRVFLFGTKRNWETIGRAVDSGQADVAVELLHAIRIPTGLLQLRLLHAVAEREGADAARRVLTTDLSDRRYKAQPWDPATYQAAEAALEPAGGDNDDGVAVERLGKLIADLSGPERCVELLRGHHYLTPAEKVTFETERYAMDWELIQTEHARKPFSGPIIRYLRDLPGSPLGRRQAPNPKEALTAAVNGGETTLDAALREVRPAKTLLGVGAEAGWWRRPDEPLTGLCRETLGADADAWMLALELVDDFPGTLAELLSTATLAAGPAEAARRSGG